jgi:hypothetical protein
MEVLNSPNLLFKWKDQTRILTKEIGKSSQLNKELKILTIHTIYIHDNTPRIL